MSDEPEPQPGAPHLLNLGKMVVDFVRDIVPQGDMRSVISGDDKEEWRKRYWNDPVAFSRDHFTWPLIDGKTRFLTDYQQDCMRRLVKHKRLAVYGPRALGKCVADTERIPLADGRVVAASELVGRQFVLLAFAPDGKQVPAAARAQDDGVKPVYRVRTKCGREVIRTGNHPLFAGKLTRCGGRAIPCSDGWQRVDALSVGDLVLIPNMLCHEGGRPVDEDWVKLAAYLLGDGGTINNLIFTQEEGPIKEEAREIVVRLGSVCVEQDKHTFRIVGPERKQFLRGSNPVLNLATRFGLMGKMSKEKAFPDWVWELPNSQLAIFLNRLFSCDGYAYTYDKTQRNGRVQRQSTVGITLASEQMIRDIEFAFLRLGICGRVRKREAFYQRKIDNPDRKAFFAWEWAIYKRASIQRFADLVGIFGKEEALSRAVESSAKMRVVHTWQFKNAPSGYRWEKISAIDQVGEQSTVAIEVAGYETYITTFVEHNTKLAAHLVWWFLFTRDGHTDWKIPITAGGYRQLEQYLFPEIHACARRLRWDVLGRRPMSKADELMKLTIQGETGRAFGAASSKPELIEGAHAPQLFYVLDESKSVADGVFDAIEGMAAAAGFDDREMYILAISTPGPCVGRFWQICTKQLGYEDWDNRHVTAKEAMRAGRMTVNWAQQRARQWGTTSSLFRCHVKGEFASISGDGIIPHFWAEDAQNRGLNEASGPEDGSRYICLAVDVASTGQNETTIAVRKGWACTDLIAFHDNDTMRVVERVQEWASITRPQSIVIDAVGVGAGVYDRLTELGYPTVAFRGGESAPDTDASGQMRFLNRRAWAWWHLRELLHPHGLVKLVLPHEDKLLLAQLAAPKYLRTQHDLIKVESKDEIEKRLRKLAQNPEQSCSPDRADAVVMAFSDSGVSAFEEAYALAGLHTAQSLARLGGISGPDAHRILQEQVKAREKQEAKVKADREAQAAARMRNARPDAVQYEDMLFGGGTRSNTDLFRREG